MIHSDLICYEYDDHANLDVDDIKECIAAQEDTIGDRLVYRLQISGKQTTMTNEGRKYLEKHGLDVKKEAYIIKSLAHKMIYNLFLKMRRTNYPTKTFDHIDKALDWLKG